MPRKKLSQSDDDEHNEVCEVCDLGGNLLCCDTCTLVFHTHCLALKIIPDGLWSCPECTAEESSGTGIGRKRMKRKDRLAEEPADLTVEKKSASKFRGVISNGKRWQAQFQHDGETLRLGRFDSEIAAAKKYDQVARQRLGARAVLNFPSEVNTPNDADISDAMEYKEAGRELVEHIDCPASSGKRKRKRPDKYNSDLDGEGASPDSTETGMQAKSSNNGPVASNSGRGRGKGRPKGRGKSAAVMAIRGRAKKQQWPRPGAGAGYNLASVLASVRQIAKGTQLDSHQYSEMNSASTSENMQHLSIIKMALEQQRELLQAAITKVKWKALQECKSPS